MNMTLRLKVSALAKTLLFSVTFTMICAAQTATKDISSLIAAGKITGNQYQNDYLGLTFTAEGGHVKPSSVTNLAAGRARIVEAISDSDAPDSSYSFEILVDGVANYPQIKSPAQYLRSVRHSLEKEGLRTLREEFSVEISGIPFTGAIMEVPGEQIPYFRGMYTAFVNGYIVSFDLTARKEPVIEKLVASLVKFKGQVK
jgi:hypothetical protein